MSRNTGSSKSSSIEAGRRSSGRPRHSTKTACSLRCRLPSRNSCSLAMRWALTARLNLLLIPRCITVWANFASFVPPSIQMVPPNGQTTTRKGGPVSFECRTTGNPTPVVQWSKKDGILPTGMQVQSGYLLSLADVQRQHAGVYQCTASNGIGQPVTAEIDLHVLYPPEVNVLRSWVNTGEGLEARLDCMVHADPPAEVTWYQNSFLLQPTDRRVMSHQGLTHTLHLRNVQLPDFGNYSCVVVNSIGREKKFIELSGKPGPPQITSSQYSMPHEYNLTWTVQSVFPIMEVRILYRMIQINSTYHHPGQWHDLLVRPHQFFNPSTSERTQSYRLANLQAESVYECLVQTKNQHGFGELSDLHQWFTSQKGRPFVSASGACSSFSKMFASVFTPAALTALTVFTTKVWSVQLFAFST